MLPEEFHKLVVTEKDLLIWTMESLENQPD